MGALSDLHFGVENFEKGIDRRTQHEVVVRHGAIYEEHFDDYGTNIIVFTNLIRGDHNQQTVQMANVVSEVCEKAFPGSDDFEYIDHNTVTKSRLSFLGRVARRISGEQVHTAKYPSGMKVEVK